MLCMPAAVWDTEEALARHARTAHVQAILQHVTEEPLAAKFWPLLPIRDLTGGPRT